MNFRSIRFLILLSFLALGLLFFGFTVVFVPLKARQTAENVLLESTGFTVGLLSDNLALGMQAAEIDGGASIAQTLSLLKSDQIGSIVVADANRTTVNSFGASRLELGAEGQRNEPTRIVVQRALRDAKGTCVGAVEIVFNKSKFTHSVNAFSAVIWIAGLVMLLGVLVAGVWLSNMIIRPLEKSIAMLRDIASGSGDLTRRLDAQRQDEVGEQARNFNAFMEKLQRMVGQLKASASELAQASTGLETISRRAGDTAAQMNEKASGSAHTMRGVTGSLQEVVASIKSSSDMVSVVATSIEEMSSSIAEVTRNCQREAEAAQSADRQVDAARQLMADLDKAASAINKIVEVISDISDKTNLLALNATIEAASAGESGKGFAVVAGEIKELSKQTRSATSRISQQVDEMRTSSEKTLKAITDIAGVIQQVNQISQSIVGAMQEQSMATHEIARNISGASGNMTESTTRLQSGSHSIALALESMTTVATSAKDVEESVNRSRASVETLGTVVEQLTSIVNEFKI